ncbi:hypothetical protein J3E72DRAFT_272330 [Bipolaris maydis]|nr:hypothetical protein J3E72DRAFT_272330 [Bipolaris maydis]
MQNTALPSWVPDWLAHDITSAAVLSIIRKKPFNASKGKPPIIKSDEDMRTGEKETATIESAETVNGPSTIGGAMGIALEETLFQWFQCQIGDELYLLGGATVPFVLRQKNTRKFLLVGDSYIDGVMEGSAELGIKYGLLEEISATTAAIVTRDVSYSNRMLGSCTCADEPSQVTSGRTQETGPQVITPTSQQEQSSNPPTLPSHPNGHDAIEQDGAADSIQDRLGRARNCLSQFFGEGITA